ncbi:CbiX/SirB N-terminal domain-containing protein [Paralimibaculum aggregatum]|uniref:CbiX/SirB N-terminal domain-containing protein n=1 Tax=Paralimibaculum aggregatum TaxID=3036245 RepID=A0ABQ6LN76_9RHOB|nr:CbiX/SirB N-terminal domain-containing protein [Limibaculum sp. NKW23]GMG84662.1 CbiX/SirB N-terminal domain-containing protein [Limibaculum sp. NKW23]
MTDASDVPPQRRALIVAHGSPSKPGRPQAAIEALAETVAGRLPGWAIRGATLAAPGALDAAVAALGGRGFAVYPHFMADGWFVSDELPRRLAESGGDKLCILPPLGLDPALPPLCLARAREAAGAAGFAPAATGLLIAAHGSPSDPRAGTAARAVGAAIAAERAFREIRMGFVDEPPFLAEAARDAGQAICLPLFAGRAGHVLEDLPEALAEGGFRGPVMAPIGTDPEIPAVIASALDRQPA